MNFSISSDLLNLFRPFKSLQPPLLDMMSELSSNSDGIQEEVAEPSKH